MLSMRFFVLGIDLIVTIKSSITNIIKENTSMDNNTRKLLNLTDVSFIFNEDWLSREARNNCSVNMMTRRLVNDVQRYPLNYQSILKTNSRYLVSSPKES